MSDTPVSPDPDQVHVESAWEEAVRLAGGPTAMAKICSTSDEVVTKQQVVNWLNRPPFTGPAKHAVAVESATGVSRRRLRPQDWQKYWPKADEERRVADDKKLEHAANAERPIHIWSGEIDARERRAKPQQQACSRERPDNHRDHRD